MVIFGQGCSTPIRDTQLDKYLTGSKVLVTWSSINLIYMRSTACTATAIPKMTVILMPNSNVHKIQEKDSCEALGIEPRTCCKLGKSE